MLYREVTQLPGLFRSRRISRFIRLREELRVRLLWTPRPNAVHCQYLSVIFLVPVAGSCRLLRFSNLSFLKAENAFSGLACVEDVPFRDGAGGQSVEVITNGTGREKPEIGKPVCNPG